MLWKTAKPFARRGAAAGGVGMLLSGETDFAMAGFSPAPNSSRADDSREPNGGRTSRRTR